ncbi:acetyltransferase [Salmonella enterica]|nr:acetyltransferase [Salmonella enterica]EDW0436484.1 acetyltransferase [Salmonella enterica subsp. enterica serovar Lexington]EAX6960111.1 acetyltransferase [Salmonella enterica]EIB4643904.1 acetyltransferase [Salmonella enterica]EKH8224204.1 acetyltransferase [Salmonella enterica]
MLPINNPGGIPTLVPETPPATDKDYPALWQAWAKEAPAGGHELREMAVERLLACLAKQESTLDLSELNLSSLPDLPPLIKTLHVNDNHLSSLPDLPESLQILICSFNPLEQLPPLPYSLKELTCSACHLKNLPSLPDALEELCCSGNSLEELPVLPVSMRYLTCTNNGLRSLPALPESLRMLICSDNPLSALPGLPGSLCSLYCSACKLETLPDLPESLNSLICPRNQLREMPTLPLDLDELNYLENPLLQFPVLPPSLITLNNSPYEGGATNTARPLTDSVADWFPLVQQRDIRERFREITHEANAGIFSEFLDRLRNRYADPQYETFRYQVMGCLIRLAASPGLREKLFMCALGATARCDDRVSLSWNNMRIAEMAYTVEQHGAEHNLPKMVDLAREVFRMERLTQIASQKLAQIQRAHEHFNEDLEVLLGYQTALQHTLRLTQVVPDMYFFTCSYLTTEDVEAARIQVQTAENQHFLEWLSLWEPWQAMLKRLNPAAWDAAESEKNAFTVSEEFQRRINAKLETPGSSESVPNKTMQEAGVEVMKEKLRELFMPCTLSTLEAKSQLSLLEPVWDLSGNQAGV